MAISCHFHSYQMDLQPMIERSCSMVAAIPCLLPCDISGWAALAATMAAPSSSQWNLRAGRGSNTEASVKDGCHFVLYVSENDLAFSFLILPGDFEGIFPFAIPCLHQESPRRTRLSCLIEKLTSLATPPGLIISFCQLHSGLQNRLNIFMASLNSTGLV